MDFTDDRELFAEAVEHLVNGAADLSFKACSR